MTQAYNNSMASYIIGVIIGLVINGFLAKIPAKMAEEKGYSYGGYWCLSFFFTFIAGMLVAARIPARNDNKRSNESYSNCLNNSNTSHQYKYKQSTNQNTIANVVKPMKKQIKSFDLGYSLDVDVQITKAELLLDEALGDLYLDVEIYNVSDKVITFMDISVECYDTVGDKLSDDYIVEHSLIDISTKPREVFEDTCIKLNDKRIRNIKVNIKKLMYEDGEVVRYTGDEKLVRASECKKVDDLDVSHIEFSNECITKEVGDSQFPIKYCPYVNIDGTWTCCCGRVNAHTRDVCCLCGRDKEKQINIINEDYISRAYDEYQELKKKQEEERRTQHELDMKAIREARKKAAVERNEALRMMEEIKVRKKKKAWIVAAGVFIVIFIIVKLFNNV